MNYRHAFHAGNFADLVKHAALTALLARLRAQGGPISVLDTHAGAGVYDLGGEMARKSGEGAAAAALMAATDAPAAFEPLRRAVQALNPKGGVRLYPGSPVVAARMLGAKDRYVGCELRDDDHALLAGALRVHGRGTQAQALKADGYGEAERLAAGPGRRLVLIDPPFERADEYDRVVQAVAAVLARDAAACLLVWLPLKDLDTFDRFVGRIEDLEPPASLVVECRLRPLTNPMAMNGCALVVVGAPEVAGAVEAASRWVAAQLGDSGEARVWRFGA